MGRLAISRAFGDFEFKILKEDDGSITKKAYINSVPEIRHLESDPENDEFILLASDGLFDKFSSQESVEYIKNKMKTMPYMEQNMTTIARSLANEAIYSRQVRDNVTVVLAALNRG
mmetsp:Transcript_104402/g.144483  ORF Transcript_104402/g.144483 Transcript_104402/m.144483 type:complete len:116 (+) Transcript_104402:796-1143(+)